MDEKTRKVRSNGMRRGTLLAVLAAAVVLSLVVAFLFLQGYIRLNYPSISRYPVRGLDVSHHQGDIDWSDVSAHDLSFAYIKATEGTDFRDRRFAANWSGARREGLTVGAYHFFTFCAPGDAQAANFLDVVPVLADTLPPAVDVEFIGNCTRWTSIDDIRRELGVLLVALQRAIGRPPILYVNQEAYRRIVSGHFPDNALWVRNIVRRPALGNADSWLFWQFADRGRVPGIRGPVDLNVFAGTRSDFVALATP